MSFVFICFLFQFCFCGFVFLSTPNEDIARNRCGGGGKNCKKKIKKKQNLKIQKDFCFDFGGSLVLF